MLCFLIFLMFEDVMPYALWSCLLDATLLDLLYLMLRCLTFPASLCLMSSLPRYSFWSYLHVFTLLDLLYIRLMLPLDLPCVMFCCLVFSVLCSATRSCLYDARLLDLIYFMLRCFTLPTSCQTAWCRVHQVMLFHLFFMMLGCLVFSISCSAAGPSHLMSSCLMSPKSRYPFCFFSKLLHFLIWSSSCHAASPPALPPVAWCFRHQIFDFW